MPKKIKHRKWHKGRRRKRTVATTNTRMSYGNFGLKSEGSAWVTSRQIEAGRRAMTRFVKRGGKIWIRIFPDKPVTAKGTQATMGSGKGAVDHYVSVVRPGTIIYEMSGVSEEVAREAMRLAAHKMPIKTKFIVKE